MTLFPRLLPLPARARGLAPVRLAIGLAAAAAATLLLLAGPARAEVVTVEGTTVGLQATNQTSFFHNEFEHRWNAVKEEIEVFPNPGGPKTFRNPAGNPVVHAANTYAIYWDPQDRYNPEWQHLINVFMQSMGASSGSLANVFAVDGQYLDSSNKPATSGSVFHAAYTDTHKYPPAACKSPLEAAVSCLTDGQLQAELQSFISQHGLPTGMGTIYYLLTPPAVTVCVDAAASRCSEFERSKGEVEKNEFSSATYKKAICSYHSAINPGSGDANTILYGVLPWSAGSAGQDEFTTLHGQAAYCQDGGFDPTTKPTEEREKIKPRTAQEEQEFAKKGPTEKEQIEKLKALQEPHDQQPNQASCPNLGDGLCDAGLADLIINQMAVEQQNIVTDPLLSAWKDGAGKELTDQCRNFFAAGGIAGGSSANPDSGAGTLANQKFAEHGYYLNTAFDLAADLLPYPGVPCITGANLLPEFTAPNPVNNGETVSFDGMESIITLGAAYTYPGGPPAPTYAKYKWEFGDGSPVVEGYAPGAPTCETPWLSPCAASALHSYQYGGTYPVSLTVTDVAGHVASITHPVTVIGPPAPSGGGGGGGGGGSAAQGGSAGSTAGGSSGGGGGTAPASKPSVPPPVAAAAVVSHSLKSSLRKGLLVRYSVNGQVAGHFEVLLSRTLARQLGVGGPTAVGLPQGTPPQVIIAKAVLVTTAAGRSTFILHFSKRTAAHLARRHKVSLMLRLIVRNAASRNPATTTVLSTFTLSH